MFRSNFKLKDFTANYRSPKGLNLSKCMVKLSRVEESAMLSSLSIPSSDFNALEFLLHYNDTVLKHFLDNETLAFLSEESLKACLALKFKCNPFTFLVTSTTAAKSLFPPILSE